MNHFYSGMLHPLLVPAHLIALIALGLWLGQRWPVGVEALVGLALALLAGLLGSTLMTLDHLEPIALAIGTVIAVATATNLSSAGMLKVCIAVALGLVLGLDSRPDGLAGRGLWLSLAGTWLGVLIFMASLLIGGEKATRPWMRIGVRVVASWVAASAILALALAVVGPVAKTRPGAAQAASAVR